MATKIKFLLSKRSACAQRENIISSISGGKTGSNSSAMYEVVERKAVCDLSCDLLVVQVMGETQSHYTVLDSVTARMSKNPVRGVARSKSKACVDS